MSEAIYEIALDLHSTMSQASLAVKQGDTDRKVYISLREDGKPYRIERGAFAVFSTITPEGKVIEDNCIVEDNKIVYGFTEALTASVGVMDVEIRLYDVNSKHIISPVFTLIVDPRAAVGDKVKEATDSFTSLDGMYNKLNAVANEVQTKLDNGEFVGETGASAGFGAVTANAVSLSPGTPPTVSIETSGPDTAKNFNFSFGIPTPSDLDFKVDPIFANNSWDTIAKVARYGDPSKYWKVGDYKMIDIPHPERKTKAEIISVEHTDCDTGEILFNSDLYLKRASSKLGIHKFTFRVGSAGSSLDSDLTDNISPEHLFAPSSYFGITLINHEGEDKGEFSLKIKVTKTKSFPLQIIGFNHDKVTDPYNYGKQKAGLTLQLGCSRNMYGNDKASLFTQTIDGIMSTAGKYFTSPNRVMADLTDGATNWAEGGFRVALQSLFDNTEIAANLVEVHKYTSQYFNSGNHWASPFLTNDKVFLPSEWEVFGFKVYAPAQEGDQYEFYKDGYSKFMWSDELLNGEITTARIWLRSAVGSKVSKDTPDSVSTCSIYTSVLSQNPTSVSYTPSWGSDANSTTYGYIAPCICL